MAADQTTLSRALEGAAIRLMRLAAEPICKASVVDDGEPSDLDKLGRLAMAMAEVCDEAFRAVACEGGVINGNWNLVREQIEDRLCSDLFREARGIERDREEDAGTPDYIGAHKQRVSEDR